MKNLITSLIIIIAACGTCLAQTPTYSAMMGTLGATGGALGSDYPPDTIGSQRFQTIYHSSDFNPIRSGSINNVYFRIGPSSTRPAGPTVYHKLRILMGYSPKPAFKRSPNIDSFLTDLQMVYYQDSINLGDLSDPKIRGTWLKLPLNKGNFYLDTSRYFAIEVADGPPNVKNSIDLLGSYVTEYRTLVGFANAPTAKTGENKLPEFGFDIDVSGVEGIKNIQSFGLFPNPSSGSFQMSFDAAKPVRMATITVRDGSGKQVYTQHYEQVGAHFFKEMNLSILPKGIYYLQLDADTDRLRQKIVIK